MAMIEVRGQTSRPVSAGTLMAAEMTRPFDAEVAWEVLAGVMTGLTVLKACEMAGVSRSTVYAWRLLRPAFDSALKEARVWLGEYQQELATEEGDPAMMSARLRLAASYDRRIKGGDEQEGSGSLTVQVLKLG